MQNQKLCLKWNNHTLNLLSVLGGFQQRDILVDVTISCEGKNIKAHKMVLSACSPYFQSIFMENPCQHPVVIMNGIKYEDITAILNFMYKGEVNVSQDGLNSFLQAAEALKVKGLAEVCGEKSTNSSSKEIQQNDNVQQPQPSTSSRPPRTDTPPRRRHRNRKRSLSDSNRSDDEGTSRKQQREPSSPEIHELSGDESYTGDTNSNGPPFNSTSRVPQNTYSRSHQSSNLRDEEDEEFEVEPSRLLEQTLTTQENVSVNSSNAENKLRIERIMGNAELESSNLQEPESPPDIKPIIDYGDSSAGPSDGTMMLYNEQSQPGPSSVQDGSLLHDNAHAQEFEKLVLSRLCRIQNEVNEIKKIKSGNNTISAKVIEIPKLPLTTRSDLQDIEKWLAVPTNVEVLLQHFASIGGKSVKDTTRRLLRNVFSQELSVEINWTGKNGKFALKNTTIVKIIIGSSMLSFSHEGVTENTVEEIIKTWFRFSKDRGGGREKRRNKNLSHGGWLAMP